MILAASQRDELVISADDLQTANAMVTDLEADMPGVFSKIGRTDVSLQTDRFLSYLSKHREVKYVEAYRFIHAYFPSSREFEDMLAGLIRSGQVRLEQRGQTQWLVYTAPTVHPIDPHSATASSMTLSGHQAT
jgi:hypothetical protein